VFVAGMRPLAREGLPRFRPLVPIAFGRARAPDQQFADLARAELATVLPDDLCIIARHRLAGRSVADLARAIAQANVQHLGRADAVQDVDADDLAPALGNV